jgi:hypothetical protein
MYAYPQQVSNKVNSHLAIREFGNKAWVGRAVLYESGSLGRQALSKTDEPVIILYLICHLFD